jgi:hypothetical protein
MSTRAIWIGTASAAVAVPIIAKLAMNMMAKRNEALGQEPPPDQINAVDKTIKKTLKKHKGEDTPMVHAFEDAIQA